MRRWVAAAALVAAGSLLAGCGGDSGARIAACDVDPATAALAKDREAAGVADCSTLPRVADASSAGAGGSPPLPAASLDCLGAPGQRIALADLRGPAVVNFWSTTCAPCRKEMPVLEQFRRAYGDRVTLLGVNYADTYPGAAIDFARIVGATYPSLADPCARLRDSAVVLQGLPQFVFLRADGSWVQSAGGVESLAQLLALASDKLGIDLPPAPVGPGEPAGAPSPSATAGEAP